MAIHGSSIAHSNIALNRRFGTFSRLGGGRFAGYIEGNKTIIENNFYGQRYDFGPAPMYQQPNIWDRASAFLKGFLDGLVGWLQNRPPKVEPEVKIDEPKKEEPKKEEPKKEEPKKEDPVKPEGPKTEYKGTVEETPATRTYTVNIQCKRRADLDTGDGRKWYEAIPMQKFYEAYGLDTSWPKDKQKAFKEFIQNTILNGNNALVAGDHEVDPDKKYTFTYGGESIDIDFDEVFWAKQKPQPYCLGGNVRNANVHEKSTPGSAKATITGTKEGKTTGTYTGTGETRQEAIDNAKDDAKKNGVNEDDITNIEFSGG